MRSTLSGQKRIFPFVLGFLILSVFAAGISFL